MANIYTLRQPEDTERGAYALLVNRSGGLFGSGPDVFYVDSVDINATSDRAAILRGKLEGGEIVVQFPLGMPWIMVRRARVEPKSQLELAKEHKAEQDELDKVFEGDRPELAAPGQYA